MSDRRSFNGGPLADPEERRALFATLDSFRQYRRQSHYNVTHRRRQNLYALPTDYWRTLAAPPLSLLDVLNNVDDALDSNADIADAILELALHTFDLSAEPKDDSPDYWHGTAQPGDITKVHSTIRQLYRDWSHEGFSAEVKPLLNILLDDLGHLYPNANAISPPSLLLPGAGLGRLLFELSLHGYEIEGNEISYHQLLTSNFVLNATTCEQQYKLYPFVSTFTNHKSRANQFRSVSIPDVHPASKLAQRNSQSIVENLKPGTMNMTAGDFLTSYGDEDSCRTFDAVISVYFIDTAPNLIRYIETVRNCLKIDGLWINIGPLLWHFDGRSIHDHKKKNNTPSMSSTKDEDMQSTSSVDAGIAEPGSVELTDDEVISLLKISGFEILKHDYIPIGCGGYIQDPDSMIQARYENSHWIARKLSEK